MKILRFFGLLLLAVLQFTVLTGIVLYGLQVANDWRNLASDLSNTLGFGLFFATIIFFWAGLYLVALQFWTSFKKLSSRV